MEFPGMENESLTMVEEGLRIGSSTPVPAQPRRDEYFTASAPPPPGVR